jgi:hypothetical protein
MGSGVIENAIESGDLRVALDFWKSTAGSNVGTILDRVGPTDAQAVIRERVESADPVGGLLADLDGRRDRVLAEMRTALTDD